MPKNPVIANPDYVRQYVARHQADIKALNEYLAPKVGDGVGYPFGRWIDYIKRWKAWRADIESTGITTIDYWWSVQLGTQLQSWREEWRWFRQQALDFWPDDKARVPPDVGWPDGVQGDGPGEPGGIGSAIESVASAAKWVAIAWLVGDVLGVFSRRR